MVERLTSWQIRKLDNNEILAAAKEYAAGEARGGLMNFIKFTKPDYESGWFNELLCAEMDKFIDDVRGGKMPRLMIFAPPRSGKSEVASRRFPAYALGHHPNWNIISCSYSSDLSNRMSRDTQRIIDSELYPYVFPDTCLNSSNIRTTANGAIRTSELWEVVDRDGNLQGGAYRAAGVNGGITGQGMNIGIIDDPAKDYKTASSHAYQESVIDWFETTFFTRVDPRLNGIIIILTRWHELDLAGQLLDKVKQGGEKWRIVSFPMESEKEEVHEINGKKYKLRDEGDILFPERMPKQFVEKCKAMGPLVWNALYQQRPTSKGGSVIKGEWFKYYQVLPQILWRGIYVDTAQKKGEHNDKTVFECWGMGADGNVYLLDVLHGKFEAWELEIKAPSFWKKHHFRSKVYGPLRYMAIEDKSSGTGLIQKIRRDGRIPIKEIPRSVASGSKASRVMDIQGYIKSGLVYLPDPSCEHEYNDHGSQTDCEYLDEFLRECESFSMEMSHAHDDFIDPMCDAITDMLGTRTGGFLDVYIDKKAAEEEKRKYRNIATTGEEGRDDGGSGLGGFYG